MHGKVLEQAQIVWNYHKMGHNIFENEFASKVDGILVFCSSDVSVADVAARLWLDLTKERIQKRLPFPYLIFSGGIGSGPHSGANLLGWSQPEADVLAEHAKMIIEENLDPTHSCNLFIENQSRNTGENTNFTHQLILKNDLPADKFILVQKPFMERRTYATFKRRWPEPDIKLFSSNVSFYNYSECSRISLEEVIGIMLGDLQRIKLYAPPHGTFQISQSIPDEAWRAYEYLTTDEEIVQKYPKFKMNLIL